ncbi:hypothetical protein B0H14DRAFT_2777077 [Mycena olivaceomarginata]|nr:hypothetical protein B0H14DRAFT_2777077 [Mycena olivaceomarginata]
MRGYHLYDDDDDEEDGVKDLLVAAIRLVAVFSESDSVSLGDLSPPEILNLADYLCEFLHDLDQPPQRTPTQLVAASPCPLDPPRRCRCRPRCQCRFPFPCPLLLPAPADVPTKLSLNITSRHRGGQPAAMIRDRGGDEGHEEDQVGSEDESNPKLQVAVLASAATYRAATISGMDDTLRRTYDDTTYYELEYSSGQSGPTNLPFTHSSRTTSVGISEMAMLAQPTSSPP